MASHLRGSGERDSGGPIRIVVAGYIVRGPLGGLVWHHMQYVLGLQRLGHEVLFLEDGGDDAWSCYDPVRGVTDDDCSYGLSWAHVAFGACGAGPVWAFHEARTGRWHGPMAESAVAFCETADLLLNLSGSNPVRPWLADIPVRAYVDTDPVFTQVRNLTDPKHRGLATQHNRFLTFGENVGPTGGIPDDGFPWVPTRQPVVIGSWSAEDPPPEAPYTTVMQWSSYPPVEYRGQRYGMKSESFEQVRSLPARVDVALEVALGSADAPRQALSDSGWRLVDPLVVTSDADAFQRYVRSSRGEFAVAKQGYVAARSGWFSERSANYLASGRPVITQDTGFGAFIPVGAGVLAYGNLEEAIECIRMVETDYERHRRAAREVADVAFDSERVLTRLLDDLLP